MKFTDPKVYVGTDDWANAAGAMLTEDDRVVPMVELLARGIRIELDITNEFDPNGYNRCDITNEIDPNGYNRCDITWSR